jgi:branched-chain amino acid transport system permease protein
VSLTGGDNGLGGITRPAPFGIDLTVPLHFYGFTLTLFLGALALIALFVRSPMGAAMRGTRDQPRRMSALGHNVWLIRWLAFIMAGFWGALAGLLYMYYHAFISPHSLFITSSAEVLLMVISGGAGTLFGPMLGATLVLVLKNIVSAYIERWLMLLGMVFVLIVIFLPDGLVPGLMKLWTGRRDTAGSRGGAN